MSLLVKKILSILAMVAVVQCLIGICWYRHTLLEPFQIDQWHSDNILYLGDSTLRIAYSKDSDKRNIATLLEGISGKKIACIALNGYHLGIFNLIVRNIAAQSKSHKTVIVPINMRQFSLQWQVPWAEYKLSSRILEHDMLWSVIYRPVSIYSDYFNEEITNAVYRNENVYDYDRLAGKVKDFQNDSYKSVDKTKMRNKIIFHYRYRLDPAHKRILALKELCNTAKVSGINLVFYITPIDFDAIDKYYPGTGGIVDDNIKVVVEVIKNSGFDVLDLSRRLTTDYFSWVDNKYPNEHLNQYGRQYVAKQIFDRLSGNSGI